MNHEHDELHITLRHINGSWHVVARGLYVEYTHQHPFRDHRMACRLVKKVDEAIDHGRSLDLTFWDSDFPSEWKPLSNLPSDYPPVVDLSRLSGDDYLRAAQPLHDTVGPFFVDRKDPLARELRHLPPSELVAFY